jgi:hypothetical protein
MNRFTGLLAQINQKLDLPQPTKSRILLEIASDLDDMYQIFVHQGLSEREAAAKVQDQYVISDEVLEELVQIHESAFRKLLGKLSEQAQTRWERVVLFAVILFVCGATGNAIFSTRLFEQASGFIWPILGISLGAVIISVRQFFKLYIKKDHNLRRLRDGLSYLLLLSMASLLTGFYGVSVEMYRSTKLIIADVDMTISQIVQWGISCSAMLMVSLLVAIATALVWFVLMDKVERIELADTAWLFD